MDEERDNIIELTDENGDVQEFEHLDTILKDDIYYVALTPVVLEEDDENDEQEIFVMKIIEDESGNEMLTYVEDDVELDEVFNIFQERYEASFEELS